jgi:5-methylcytosine-specific restriction endonuclease McrA
MENNYTFDSRGILQVDFTVKSKPEKLLPERPCQYCWETFTPKHRNNTKYCSKKCARAIHKERQREKSLLAIVEGESNQYLKLRFTVLRRDNFKCQYCGRGPQEGVILHVDHKFPKSKGGEFALENLVTACFECNIGKGDAILGERETNRQG